MLLTNSFYDFTWNKLADWYLEIAKIEKNKEEILVYLLRHLLVLWHPFIPYVTETIWSSFNDSLLMVAKWPVAVESGTEGEELGVIQNIVVAIRNARSAGKVEPARKLSAIIYGHSHTDLLVNQQELILKLKTGLSSVVIKEEGPAPDQALAAIANGLEIYLLGAVDEEKEKERWQAEKLKIEKLIANQAQKLANSDFVGRAPAKIVAAEQDKLLVYQTELAKIDKVIKNL